MTKVLLLKKYFMVRILIIDDEEKLRSLTLNQIERNGQKLKAPEKIQLYT